jgi:hypothetical protein
MIGLWLREAKPMVCNNQHELTDNVSITTESEIQNY